MLIERLPRLARPLSRAIVVGALGWMLLAPSDAQAGPPDDEWSLEHSASDALLVKQRFAKLKRNPFDQKQWRALDRALGTQRLAKRIASARAKSPKNLALGILAARASLALGDPAAAAEQLDALEDRAGKWRGRVFAMRVDALEASKRYPEAIAALESDAAQHSGDPARKSLRRAYLIADKANLHDDSLRLAKALAAGSPKDVDARLRVASAAAASGNHELADESFLAAIKHARPARRDDLTARRARARLEAGAPGHAAQLTWGLLHDASNGRRTQRESWWNLLEAAHRRAATSEVLAGKLTGWLKKGDHATEPAAWRTLARAQGSAGIDPVPAWRRALKADPRDGESRAALIQALEAAGDSEGALEEYRALVAQSKHEAQLGLDMAMRLITNGERETGMQVAREVEARAGKRAHTLLLLLEFYNDLEEPEKALDIARKLVRLQPRNADARVALGEQLFQMGHRDEAMEHWAMLPKLVRPGHAGWVRYAEILSEHGGPRGRDAHLRNKAEDALKKALAVAPDNPRYLRLRAVLYEEFYRNPEAYATWQRVRALATAPEDRLLREEARTRVVEFLVNGRRLKGRSQLRTQAIGEARAELAKGASPEALEAGLFLSELYTREENYGEAVAKLLHVNEMFPGQPELLLQLASAERRDGKIKQAMDTLRQVMEIDPSRRAEILSELSELSFRVGDIDTALETATDAASNGRDGTRALIRLGELHERNGDLDRARQAYRTALDSDPKDPRARMKIAELQLTSGDVEASAAAFRGILEEGGPADLLRQAGHRALDLAEATGQSKELLDLAVRRTKRDPDADEPREFLLDTLDRTDDGEVESWLVKEGKRRDKNRMSALRRPLVASLSRGSISVRLRAAAHLGELGLPDTAVVLARMGSQLTTPRDATTAVRTAFENARATAIRSAGSLDDPKATPVLVDLLQRKRYGTERVSAAWALAQIDDPAATGALRGVLQTDRTQQIMALSCIALAHHSRGAERAQDRINASELRKRATKSLLYASAYAEANLLTDAHAPQLIDRLDASDPLVGAIAAWRLGNMDRDAVDPQVVEALFRRYLGPSGLARDAAGGALARLLGGQRAEAPALPVMDAAWELSIRRWITETVTPDYQPLSGAQLEPYRAQLARALAANARGTRAERLASERATASCGPEGATDGRSVCLGPLAEDPIRLAPRVDK
jgi:tetratricopeptide (TPR) repeat protein